MTDRVPVPDPLDADAYRADCARRGVEPGPLPALSWRSDDGRTGPVASWTSEDGRVEWLVEGTTYVEIRIGRVIMVNSAIGWYADDDSRCGTSADWAEAVRLMQAADGTVTP